MVQYDISIYDATGKKLCSLLDTSAPTEGEQVDVSISQEMGGWKEQSFSIPWMIGKEKNFRIGFLRNENLIRVIRESGVYGRYEDWFIIREPQDSHDGKAKDLSVSCDHISAELKTKNLYVYFDDTNGIDTIGNLVSKALHGSGWTQGLCDTLYEADGTTEKIRSYSCDEKTGAYNMVTGICDLFMSYPIFNGATKTVDVHAISNKTGNIEFNYGKNVDSLQRSRDSTDIVTRLYVEGDYGDFGYVGIDDVNPTGLSYILNFDYYKEIGAFTDEHQAALDEYIATAKRLKEEITSTSAEMLDKESRLSTLWGTGRYVFYTVANGEASAYYLGNGADAEDAAFAVDDIVVAVKNSGEYSYVTASPGMTFGADIVYAIKFLIPTSGQIGAKEVAIEAKQKTIETLNEEIEKADTQKEKDELQKQVQQSTQEINDLRNGTEESEGSYELMLEATNIVLALKGQEASITSAQEEQQEAEQEFADAMGNMLHDGYWNNSNYTVGQEESLYADAVEILKIMSRPAVTYSISFLNLAALSQYMAEEIKLNMRVRIYDADLQINDWGFVEKMTEYPLSQQDNTVIISTDELNIAGNSFESVLNRMMEAANIVEQRNMIYERAAAISKGGTLSADQLNGEIDILKNQLVATKSGWYTDANGNIMFEAQDGQSAMMLSGSGFMVASGKDASGNWNWRTFGTGEGFTADLITAGILRAGTITILGTDQFYWDADNIYIFDPENPDRQIRIGKYDGTNYGIGYTTDNGQTWQNAIGFNGVTLSASTTEEIDSLTERVTVVESKVTPDAIVQTVTQSDTYKNEIGELDERISTAETKLTPEAMETTIANSEAMSNVEQTAGKINWIVESGTSSSNMTLTQDALDVISEGITLTADKINLVADDINLSGNTSVNTIVSNATGELETKISQNTEDITQTAQKADFATPIISDEPPAEQPQEGKLWIDTSEKPEVWRYWKGADVSTDREYTETKMAASSITQDNTAGQIEEVTATQKCVAQQSSTGSISGKTSVTLEATMLGTSIVVGGGTITPENPLYGIDGAEDTVSVDMDGDISITRMTAYIASYNGEEIPGAYISSTGSLSIGAQVVYALAVPEKEVAQAISPQKIEKGQIAVTTTADNLEIVIYGSGWETVNDTADIREDMVDTQNNVDEIVGDINSIEGDITAISQQILSPDEVVTIVVESDQFQTVSTQVTQTGQGQAIVQTDVSNLNGRVETIEGAVVIGSATIDIGKSNSNTRLHLDNAGIDILEDGQATISARGNKVLAPRFQVTDAQMIGNLAFRPSGGHLRLLKYGG